MHPVLNHLVQLQELILIRDEQKLALGRSHLEELDQSIRDMINKLPPDTKTLFQRLHDKDHVVVAPISQEVCAVCGMKLPISLIQAVRIGRQIHGCPNCVRMLFYVDDAARRIGRGPRRTDPQKAGIARFSSERLMIPALEAVDTEGAIRELASKLESEGFVDRADKLSETALRRETILSTAVENGLAFPHARGVEGGGLALALGLSRKGFHFDGTGKAVTKIVFFLAIPTAASAFYLKLLAGLSATFVDAENRKLLLAEKEPEGMWKALVKVTRPTIK